MPKRYRGHVRRIVVDGQTFLDLHDVVISDDGVITSDGEVVGHAPRLDVTTVVRSISTSVSVSVSQNLGTVEAPSRGHRLRRRPVTAARAVEIAAHAAGNFSAEPLHARVGVRWTPLLEAAAAAAEISPPGSS